MKNNNFPIGFLDSGVGGLTVVNELLKLNNKENIFFIGDQKNAPYGTKKIKEIESLVQQDINFLLKHNVKAIVMACNTASAVYINKARSYLSIPVIGMIDSGAVSASKVTLTKRIGIIATSATVNQHSYQKAITALIPDAQIFELSCSEFVPLIEKNADINQIRSIVSKKLSYFDDKSIDCLVLGCTHFPIIKNVISDCINSNIEIVNPAIEVIRKLMDILTKEELLSNIKKHDYFYTTYDNGVMNKLAYKLFHRQVKIKVIGNE